MKDGVAPGQGFALVTGGSGFVGSHLARRLAEAGRRVRILSRSAAPAAEGMEWCRGDIRNQEDLREAVRGAGTVFHAAALIPGKGSDGDMEETNAAGTRKLVAACLEGGVERLVLVSSVSVYRGPLAPVISEADPIGGVDAYGRSKAAAEAAVREGCGGRLKHALVRPCQIYGPGDGTGYTARMLRLLSLPILPLPGGASRTYCLLHVHDLVDALLLAEANASVRGEVYNIAPASATTLVEMAGCAAKDPGRPPIGIPVPDSALRMALSLRWFAKHVLAGERSSPWRSYAPGHTDGSLLLGGPIYDIAKARRELGFRPGVTPEKALPGLAARYV